MALAYVTGTHPLYRLSKKKSDCSSTAISDNKDVNTNKSLNKNNGIGDGYRRTCGI